MTEKSKSIRLKVEDAEQTDLGKEIARIDPEIMKILQISEKDIIEIIDNKKTVVKAYPANLSDTGKNIIRIDAYTRRNAGTTVGGNVYVCKVDVVEAEKVTIVPSGMHLTVDNLLVKFLTGELLDRPLMKENIFVVMMMAHPILFVVIDTEPDGPVIVTEKTKLHILSKLNESSR